MSDVQPSSETGPREKPPQQHGVLALCKPKGPTSAACIGKIKRRLGQKKIGHAGTLDPMASGVLLVLLGQATKISAHLMDEGDKIYSGIIRLGVKTDTWDAEGEVLERLPVTGVDQAAVAAVMSGLVGVYEQEVPAFSAAKHEGRPLYKLARKGLDVPVKKKVVSISRGEAELVGPERIRFRVTCASGTYIRSLAHSLGMRLGCGGTLEELVREYSHPFGLDAAHDFETVLSDAEGFAVKVTGIADALPSWPRLRLSGADAARVKNGARLDLAPGMAPGARVLMLDEGGEALALAEAVRDTKSGRPVWAIARGLWN